MAVAFVVADSVGAVGAFASIAEVAQIAFAPYSATVLGVYEFPIKADAKEVFVLPYKEINAVAFASDDLERVRAVQKRLLALGLTYPEDPTFWRCELGRLTKAGQARLALGEKATNGELEKEHAAVLSRFGEMLEDIKRDSPLARLVQLSEASEGRINLMQSIVPCKLSAPAASDAAPERKSELGDEPLPASGDGLLVAEPASSSDEKNSASSGEAPEAIAPSPRAPAKKEGQLSEKTSPPKRAARSGGDRSDGRRGKFRTRKSVKLAL